MKTAKTAFIGLGVMGFPMAGHLARQGYPVTVFNRTGAKARNWCEQYDGEAALTPREAASGAELAFLCVGNDDDVRSVVYGENGILAGLTSGALLVDHSTVSAALARELHGACRERGVGFLDAPVSGGQAGAENGTLTIMAGGDAADFAQAEPVMRCYGRAVTLMGPAGSGQLTKMVNQIAVAGLLQGLSEALAFGDHAGLDMPLVLDVISKGAAQSWQMDNRGETMLEGAFDFGFAVDWMRKDLAICMAEAKRNGARLPVVDLVDQFYARIQEQGGGRWDTSSLITLLKDQS